jgi:cytochrome c oxidase cbb3-type subunit III
VPIVINPKGKQPEFTLRDGRFVSIHEVSKALAAGRKMSIADARQASDWMRAHITGAVSIPYHDLGRLAEVPQDVWVIAYCACPHHLSGIIVDELKKRGHARALILDEGVLEWHRRGYPMTTAPGVGPPPEEDPIGLNHGPHAHRHHGHGH